MPGGKSRDVWEFGDFQTPDKLAASVCEVLKHHPISPTCILEPTCGRGAFLSAAAETFPAAHLIGVDINPAHLALAGDRLSASIAAGRVELQAGDFFKLDWCNVLDTCSGPWLILGNPPWVTSSELGSLESANLPAKSNVQGRSGIEALTGKSNFDLSEWMLLRYLDWLRLRGGWVAVLVKTIVARKLLVHAWKDRYPLKAAAIYPIDAMQHFGAAVDASLFILAVEPGANSQECAVFDHLSASQPSHTFGFHDGQLIADVDAYLRWQHLAGKDRHYVWRSGIKHDCAKVMELTAVNGHYRNGLDEEVTLESDLLYPLLKSSDVNKHGSVRGRFMLVTQKRPGEDTRSIRAVAPRTWAYLQRHSSALGKRRSSIYRSRPPFSVFGVGDYSFAPWKVAISGFYKALRFVPVGPVDERPAVFDDTVYFLPCRTRPEAEFLAFLLNSPPAQAFYGSMVFWSDKRPITIDLLQRLNLAHVAAELNQAEAYASFVDNQTIASNTPTQLPLLQSH